MNPEESLDRAIEMLMEVRNMPLASTPETHVERSDRCYELLHLASEIIILDVIGAARFEGDFFRRNRGEA